jgi:hypothetical protein
MAAPTEEEIRSAVKAALDERGDIDIGQWVHDLAAPIGYHARDLDAPRGTGTSWSSPCLWDDLRPTEAERLSDLLEAIYHQADAWEAEVLAKITEAVVAAGVQFAAEYPDAPRARRAVAA